MRDTLNIYEERKKEIEFYYSILVDFDINGKNVANTIDNKLFFKILKSNFLLMLYNIVEATITTGMLEIYEQLRNEKCIYSSLISEMQNIWRNYKVKEIYHSSSQLKSYINRVEGVVNDIINETPIIFNKNMLDINGNLNAKRIKEICDRHRIRYKVVDDEMILERVRIKRNALAHGDESFSDCARDITISDLEKLKDTVFKFLTDITDGMKKYYDEKQYLKK